MSPLRFLLPLALAAGTVFAAPAPTTPLSNFPGDAFLLLTSTNQVRSAADLEAEPERLPPRLRLLQSLREMPAATNAVIALPQTAGIQSLPPPAQATGRSVDEIFEEIKVRDIVKEADELRRSAHFNDAIGLIQSNLTTLVSTQARFDLLTQLGIHLSHIKDFRAAADAMQKALELKPEDPLLACNLAAVYLNLNEVDKALEALGRIESSVLKPADRARILYFTHFNYACAFSLKNKTEEALTHLELAAKYDPPRTLGDMGDPQLDNLRLNSRFVQLRTELEKPGRGR